MLWEGAGPGGQVPRAELANWPWLPWVVEEGLPGSIAFLWLEQERDKGSILGLRKSI